MRIFPILFLFCFAFGFSQNYTKQENQLISQTKKLDSLMQNNDSNIINLFDENVSFGRILFAITKDLSKNDLLTFSDSEMLKHIQKVQIIEKE